MRYWAGLCVILVPALGNADEIHLKSGGQLSGRIVERSATALTIDVGAGRVSVPVASVTKIVEGRSDFEEYEARASAMKDGDAAGWADLGAWAAGKGLGTQSREAYERALALSPSDPQVNAALGRVQVGGTWVSEEEGYRAQGYVQRGGQWMTPEEAARQEQEMAADSARAREQQAAEARARDAEARAAEAEKKAAEAEAAAQDEGLPLWYGWGAGPVVWPTQPVVRAPGAGRVGRGR
jgi:hypothetical protein